MKSGREAGSALTDVLVGAVLIVFVILPIFSAVAEKYVLGAKIEIIKDAVDMANISTYNAISASLLGREAVTIDSEEAEKVFRHMLAGNLGLDSNLLPGPDSVAEAEVRVNSLAIYTQGLPCMCPDGTRIERPAVHSHITVPLKPSLYREAILKMQGKEYIELNVHVDSDIPIDN